MWLFLWSFCLLSSSLLPPPPPPLLSQLSAEGCASMSLVLFKREFFLATHACSGVREWEYPKMCSCLNASFFHDLAPTILWSGGPREDLGRTRREAHCSPPSDLWHHHKCYTDWPGEGEHAHHRPRVQHWSKGKTSWWVMMPDSKWRFLRQAVASKV